MSKPIIADTKPVGVDVKDNNTYYWCTCGRSQKQPFCDGSHIGTDFEPMAFKASKDEKVFLCQCKLTKNPPFCDGSHNDIPKDKINETEDRISNWFKVANNNELADGEVKSVQAGTKTIALTYLNNEYGALDNACPHQGGPLSEGSIECESEGKCWLRCPWHGWDFDPLTGKSPGNHDDGVDTYPVEIRDDGIYVQVEQSNEQPRTISDVMVESMVNWGVTHVFGMVGHSNLGLAEAIRLQEKAGKLSYIGIRHEGAASFACSGFAKLSGKPAACLSIAGPGATNLLTGLWDAKVDRAPVLALTGQVNTQVFGPGAFQEIDLSSAFEAVTSFSQTVLHESNHAELMSLALKHSIIERNVSHLIFPDEVQVIPAKDDSKASSPEGRLSDHQISPSDETIEQITQKISNSSKPVIIVGYGAQSSMPDVIKFAEQLNAPVLTTFKAKGQIPDSHPLAAGVLGRSGTPIASWCMNESDLLIVLGASFSNHTGITSEKAIIQVDFDRMALGKFHAVGLPVWGEISITLNKTMNALPAALDLPDQRKDLAERWKIWRNEKKQRASRSHEKGLSSAEIFEAFSNLCPENAVISVDVGNNTYSFGRYFECANQRILMSGYLGSIGFGFPAAMGAWAATQVIDEHRQRPVISISGDGGFGQYLAEFTTAVKYKMNITHILLNNNELGKISKEQRAGNWQVWQTSLHNPSFSEFANNCGGLGIKIDSSENLKLSLQKALEYNGPSLVEIITDPELV